MKNVLLTIILVGTALTAAVSGQIRRDEGLSAQERRASPSVQAALLKTRQQISAKNLNFRVGLTAVSERDLSLLTGDVIPANIKQLAVQQNQAAAKTLNVSPSQLLNIDLSKIKLANIKPGLKTPEFEIDQFGKVKPKSSAGTPTLGKSENEKKAEAGKNAKTYSADSPYFDWRAVGITVPVRNQQCGNCWAYAVQAVYELVSMRSFNYNPFNTSEQFIVSNGNAGTCKGGNRFKANQFLQSFGAMKEDTYPDTGTNGAPVPNLSALTPFHQPIVTFGFVDPNNEQPSVTDIKKAIIAYGPVTASINATDALKNYTEGVFDEGANEDTNHAIVIVGWDDAKGAWIIRNSWGSGWGNNAGFGTEGGYAYVKYGANRIGRWAQWIVVK